LANLRHSGEGRNPPLLEGPSRGGPFLWVTLMSRNDLDYVLQVPMMFCVDLSGLHGRRGNRRVRARLLRRGRGPGRDFVGAARAERNRCEDQRHRRMGRAYRQDPQDVTSKLLKKVFALRNLESAWRVIYANGRFSKSDGVRAEIHGFAEDSPGNLRRLQRRLSRREFQFEPAKGVPIPKLDSRGKRTGKIRPIVLAPVESRIVQRALLNVLLELPGLQKYVKTPMSFGGLRREVPTGNAVDLPRYELPTAVPAAIKAALGEIRDGAYYYASADIRSFFTRIQKSTAIAIIAQAGPDDEFIAFLNRAISVELSNLTALREHADDFPIEDLGVAQGNSLSPLLGNIVLADFDRQMNSGDCACIRYIDDLLITAPTREAANAALRKAVKLLNALGMAFSPEKSSAGAKSIRGGFDFLGIEVVPGLVRPSSKAQQRLMARVETILEESRRTLTGARGGQRFDRSQSLLATLKRLDATLDGWGKHYWFCNDGRTLEALDAKIWKAIKGFLGLYADVRAELNEEAKPLLLGVTELAKVPRHPFEYPPSTSA
jgi:RNA-directed DNA polymerase